MGVLKVKTEDGFLPIGGGGSGVTAAEKALILSLFKNTAYTADMSATISRLESLWSGSGDEPNIPDVPVEPDEPDEPVLATYSVTNNLTGVTNSNAQTEVTEGDFYKAAISVDDGYILNDLTITMGGVDITDTVYGEGNILIPEVTGDIVITAVASLPEYVETFAMDGGVNYVKEDGGIGYFYNRNCTISRYPTNTAATVEFSVTNKTDAAISTEILVAHIAPIYVIAQGGFRVESYEIAYKGSIGAGATVKRSYTIPAGYHILVGFEKLQKDSFEVSVVGNLDIVELPVSQYSVVATTRGTWRTYTDDGTSGAAAGYDYNKIVTYIDTKFDEEKTIRMIIENPAEATAAVLGSAVFVHLKEPLTAAGYYYHRDSRTTYGVRANSRGEYHIPTKAGYYLGVVGELKDFNYSFVDAEV